jgi:hypothetical protein
MNSNAEKAIDHESVNFYEQLLSASMHHEKYAPLWRQTKNERGGAIIRIKTLQHMNVLHVRKLLAEEVAIMVRRQSTDYEQMRLIEDLMSRYGLQDLAPQCLAKPAANLHNQYLLYAISNSYSSAPAKMTESLTSYATYNTSMPGTTQQFSLPPISCNQNLSSNKPSSKCPITPAGMATATMKTLTVNDSTALFEDY